MPKLAHWCPIYPGLNSHLPHPQLPLPTTNQPIVYPSATWGVSKNKRNSPLAWHRECSKIPLHYSTSSPFTLNSYSVPTYVVSELGLTLKLARLGCPRFYSGPRDPPQYVVFYTLVFHTHLRAHTITTADVNSGVDSQRKGMSHLIWVSAG